MLPRSAVPTSVGFVHAFCRACKHAACRAQSAMDPMQSAPAATTFAYVILSKHMRYGAKEPGPHIPGCKRVLSSFISMCDYTLCRVLGTVPDILCTHLQCLQSCLSGMQSPCLLQQ